MSSNITVKINGNDLKMIFSLKVFRVLGKIWQLNSLPEVMQKVALIEQIESGSFEVYDVLYELLYQAIDCCSENTVKITKDDIENLPVPELLLMAEAMTKGIYESFPSPEVPEKKKIALKK